MVAEDTIVGAIVGGIIGISGGVIVLILERHYRQKDKRMEKKELLEGMIMELDYNIEVLESSKPLEVLKHGMYNQLKRTGRYGILGYAPTVGQNDRAYNGST